ncbi:MAG: amino acid ABC transporter permease [Gammaproteobacteria bacterium]
MINENVEIVIKSLPLLGQGAIITLKICTISIVVGLMVGTVFGVLNSKYVACQIGKQLIQAYVALIRGTPLFVQLLIIYFGLPSMLHVEISAELSGIIALSCNSAAYLSEIVRGGLNHLPTGQYEAAYVLGYSKVEAIFYILMPQMYKNVWSAITNEFVALIKESSILMMLGVHELTKVSKDIVTKELKPMQIYLMTALIYFLLTWVTAKILKKYEVKKYEHA